MGWVAPALVSPVLFAVVNVLDKRILTRHMPGVMLFNLLVGLTQLVWAAVLLGVMRPTPALGLLPLGFGFFSGVLWGVSILFLFYVLRTGEVSRAVPVFQTYPIFAAIMAMVFLDEELEPVKWLAIVVTVAGAVLISLQRPQLSARAFLGRSFFLLMAGSVVAAGAFVVSKVALDEIPLRQVFAVRTLGLAVTLVVFSASPATLKQTVPFVRGLWGGVGLFALTEVVLAPAAVLATLWAVSLGPVSLVSALTATRPFFIFILSVLLSTGLWRVLDEPLNRETLALKLASIAMIVGGVSFISLL